MNAGRGNVLLMTENFLELRKWASEHLQGSVINLLLYWSPWTFSSSHTDKNNYLPLLQLKNIRDTLRVEFKAGWRHRRDPKIK